MFLALEERIIQGDKVNTLTKNYKDSKRFTPTIAEEINALHKSIIFELHLSRPRA